ncbi:hypothetical protein N7508_001971 [Penicillium antarcticum]|uniref:uncharacterized protein n=1 Tax=Penicillium antarcticum TaxID=416450 RepID=UPI00238C3690|nr:uncharacterized protein N7508_001971 [Penicillium antarcticum]KAJ5317463.1 hypothetical protein N7508_001971 [Penicillium antarcticum]
MPKESMTRSTPTVIGSENFNNADIDLVLDHLQHSCICTLRVLGFNDVNTKPAPGKVYFQLLQNGTAAINTGSDGLQRLDYIVAAA